MEKTSEGKAKSRVVMVKVCHPQKEVQAVFENAKTSDIVDWIFELSQELPKLRRKIPIMQWIPASFITGMRVGMFSNYKNSGQLYGLTIYIYNKEQ